MRKIAPLNPDAQRVQEIIADLEKGVVPPVPIPQMRAMMKKRTGRLAGDPPAVARVVDQEIAGVPVRLYYPAATASAGSLLPGYVYAHGGGFVVGDLDMVETICCSICATAGIVVVSVDYRLAPEHKFPRGLEDMIAVTRHVATNAAALGIDANRLGIGGDSAGGNLAAATSQALHGRDGIALRFQVLVYPVTDLTCAQPSYEDLGTGYPLTKDRMRAYIGLYLNDADKEATDVRASPLLAKTLAGQPPALVIVAGLDPLVDEGKAYAARLVADGGEAEVVEIADHPHGFLGWTREAAAARKTLDLIGERLRQRLAQ